MEDKQNHVLGVLDKYIKNFNIDKDKVEICKSDFEELLKERYEKEYKEDMLNDFLLKLNDFKFIEIRDLRQCLEQYKYDFAEESTKLRTFVDKISRECILDQHYFSFYDIPDMILGMSPNKKDYASMLEFLQEAKNEYMKSKADVLKKPLDEIKITDEDLVPLELLRHTLDQKKSKYHDNMDFITRFIASSQEEVTKKIRQLQVENVKTKKIIENNVFVQYLNKTMEDNHKEVFIPTYKIKLVHLVLESSDFRSAKDVSRKYFDIIQLNTSNNWDFKDKLNKEMCKFCNKPMPTDITETISEFDDDRLKKVFQRMDAFREPTSTIKEEKEEYGSGKKLKRKKKKKIYLDSLENEAEDFESAESLVTSELEDEMTPEIKKDTARAKSAMDVKSRPSKGHQKDTSKDRSFGSLERSGEEPPGIEPFSMDKYKPPEPLNYAKFEEEDEEDKAAIEERKKKEAEEAAWMAKYLDPKTGEPFNPIKKFGLLENDYLVYDKVTSSYPLNLPTDYYQRYVKTTVPDKKDKKWFIRPHHIEKLTTHVKSLKDDILNTQYYSNYVDESKNVSKKDETAEAIEGLEGRITEIKDYVRMMKMNNGTWDPDEEELIYTDPDLNKEAKRKFEEFLYDGKREDKKKLLVDTFESLLYEMRRIEKAMLNAKREREYEKNRPPQDRWYELKNDEFNKELYRNRMALRPNNENKVYLSNLQDPYLY